MSRIKESSGFSLIEVAVVLFIMTMILGSILVPLNTRHNARQVADTKKTMAEIAEAISGFAAANGYLPCPDKTTAAGVGVANDGAEDVNGTACVVTSGNLPSAELGLGAFDAWGNRFRYIVIPAFASRSAGTLRLDTSATLMICAYAGCPETESLINPNDPAYVDAHPINVALGNNRAAAVVISHGPNGYGGRSAATGNANQAPVTADELANTGTNSFVTRIATSSETGAGEFDDLVVWGGKPTLFKTMVAAGRLP